MLPPLAAVGPAHCLAGMCWHAMLLKLASLPARLHSHVHRCHQLRPSCWKTAAPADPRHDAKPKLPSCARPLDTPRSTQQVSGDARRSKSCTRRDLGIMSLRLAGAPAVPGVTPRQQCSGLTPGLTPGCAHPAHYVRSRFQPSQHKSPFGSPAMRPATLGSGDSGCRWRRSRRPPSTCCSVHQVVFLPC